MNLGLLAGKVVIVRIPFPAEHRERLPYWRFQLHFLLAAVREYVLDAQEIITL